MSDSSFINIQNGIRNCNNSKSIYLNMLLNFETITLDDLILKISNSLTIKDYKQALA